MKDCIYCYENAEGIWDFDPVIDFPIKFGPIEKEVWIAVSPKGELIFSIEDFDEVIEKKINYCPMCGRKLGKKGKKK